MSLRFNDDAKAKTDKQTKTKQNTNLALKEEKKKNESETYDFETLCNGIQALLYGRPNPPKGYKNAKGSVR